MPGDFFALNCKLTARVWITRYVVVRDANDWNSVQFGNKFHIVVRPHSPDSCVVRTIVFILNITKESSTFHTKNMTLYSKPTKTIPFPVDYWYSR